MQNPYVAHDTRYAIRNHGTAKKCILTFQNKNKIIGGNHCFAIFLCLTLQCI